MDPTLHAHVYDHSDVRRVVFLAQSEDVPRAPRAAGEKRRRGEDCLGGYNADSWNECRGRSGN